MLRGKSSRLVAVILGSAIVIVGMAAAARANHIPDIPIYGARPMLPNEGYLSFQQDPSTGRFGDEWTGWLDVRTPYLGGPNNTAYPYVRSDNFVSVRTSILTDANGAVAQADRATDFNYANTVWVQLAGLSVLETSTRALTSNVNQNGCNTPNFTFPLHFQNNEIPIMNQCNGLSPTIDAYYAGSLQTLSIGETFNPSFPTNAANIMNPGNFPDGIFMANFAPFGTPQSQPPGSAAVRGPIPTVFAHEMGHFLTDGRAQWMPVETDPSHSTDSRNLMAVGARNYAPGMTANFLCNANNVVTPACGQPGFASPQPPWAIDNSPAVVGPAIANSTNPNGSPGVGGTSGINTAQANWVYAPNNNGANSNNAQPYIQRSRNGRAADRVDWNFVVDHKRVTDVPSGQRFGLEGTANADNFPGADDLYFGIPAIGTIDPPPDPEPTAANGGKDKTGLDVYPITPDFTGNVFHFVDVFSLIGQFADHDFIPNDNPGSGVPVISDTNTQLDYDLFCRGMDGNEVAGTLIAAFGYGWTSSTLADNVMGRWECANDAVGVRILAHVGEGHDGNVEIDAVIVSATPEPGTLGLITLGLIGVMRGRRRLIAI